MTITIYVDESGVDESGPALVFGGLVAEAQDWIRFSDEWVKALGDNPKLPSFHFQKMRPGNSYATKFPAMLAVIKRYAPVLLYHAIDLSYFKVKSADRNSFRPVKDPYFWSFYGIITAAAFHVRAQGLTERFEIVFDDNKIFGPRAKRWYPMIRRIIDVIQPDLNEILPVDLLFRTDDEFAPLQAADIVAGLLRQKLAGDERNQWAWQKMGGVLVSPYSEVVYREDVARRIRKMASPELLAIVAANAGYIFDDDDDG